MTSEAKHGGRRQGAGRKAALPDAIKRTHVFTASTLALLEQYRQRQGLASTSEALRHLIESFGNAKAG